MPVCQHGDIFLYETLAIAHYIDRAFQGPPLQPATALGQAETLRWVGIVNSYVFPVMNRFMKERLVRPAWGFDPDRAFLAGAEAPLKVQMRVIEAALDDGFLVGEQLTIADCFLFPHLLFFSLTPEGAELVAKAPRTQAWLDAMRARPSHAGGAMCEAFRMFHAYPQPLDVLWSADDA